MKSKKNSKTAKITFLTTDEIRNAIESLADAEDRNMSSMINTILKSYLKI